MYRHFLQTRFNIKRHPKDRYGNETLTDEWMIMRFELFEKYCIPSVTNQSVSNFKWLVYFDENTNKIFRERIELYRKQIHNFTPIYVTPPDYKLCIRKSITSRLSDDDDYVITTRIDNDDAVHKDFLLEVQKLFNFQDETFFRFVNGFQWQEDATILLRMYEKTGNHFSSRIESVVKGVDSVINVDNQKIFEVPNAKIVDVDCEKRLWLEVVHDTNVANHNRILLPEFKTGKLKEFNLDLKVSRKNMLSMLYQFGRRENPLKVFAGKKA